METTEAAEIPVEDICRAFIDYIESSTSNPTDEHIFRQLLTAPLHHQRPGESLLSKFLHHYDQSSNSSLSNKIGEAFHHLLDNAEALFKTYLEYIHHLREIYLKNIDSPNSSKHQIISQAFEILKTFKDSSEIKIEGGQVTCDNNKIIIETTELFFYGSITGIGEGILNFSHDRGSYKGQLVNFNTPHGEGESQKMGITYHGQWVNGAKCGLGKLSQNGILIYEGNFSHNAFHGQGIKYRMNDTKEYDGDWKDGERNGRGKYFENGELVYEGEFLRNQRHGSGIEFIKEGREKFRYNGTWKSGNRHGKFTIEKMQPNGSLLNSETKFFQDGEEIDKADFKPSPPTSKPPSPTPASSSASAIANPQPSLDLYQTNSK